MGRANQYKKLFPLLIEDWRNKWNTNLPFWFVQLAPYVYTAAEQVDQSQKLRNAQHFALKFLQTGTVSTLDIGYLKTAYPPHKQEVGDRLAKWTLIKLYGRKLITCGPMYKNQDYQAIN